MVDTSGAPDSCHVAGAGDPDVAGLGVRLFSTLNVLMIIGKGNRRISDIDLYNRSDGPAPLRVEGPSARAVQPDW